MHTVVNVCIAGLWWDAPQEGVGWALQKLLVAQHQASCTSACRVSLLGCNPEGYCHGSAHGQCSTSPKAWCQRPLLPPLWLSPTQSSWGHIWHRWQSWYFAKACDSGFGSCLSFVFSLRQSLCKTRLAYTLGATASASWVAGIKAPPQLNCVVLSSITSPDFVDSPIK